MTAISFETHPDRYKHWKLSVDGQTAHLTMGVELHGGLKEGYELKLNSYDLGVDIELADAVSRLRFEHPEVRAVVVDSAIDRCFCAGANIPMLGSSTHSFKVNFCKFTNETRLYIEDASRHSGQKYLAAVGGACAGGGYELALACDDILLIDDGSSAVSLPEVPLLAVLPGTGGLTRLVDKRKVRRDRADVFCTTEEGVRGKRALEWGVVDAIAPRSKFDDAIQERARMLAKLSEGITKGPGISLDPLDPNIEEAESTAITLTYRHVSVEIDQKKRTAELVVSAPSEAQPKTAEEIQAAGADQWSLRAFRELDDALLRLRVNYGNIGVVIVRTRGEMTAVLEADAGLAENADHWLANEILRFQARALRRFDYTAKSFFALADEGSCFAGSLFELLLGSDRSYMLLDDDEKVAVTPGPNNRDRFPMGTGISRLEAHFYGSPEQVGKIFEIDGPIPTEQAEELGIVTIASDDIDWDDDVRIAIEERVAMSPDSLTGMEASLRFPGPETTESKIFARLSAWQNWIFQRPNAVGAQGALTKYGEPDRPVFDFTRC